MSVALTDALIELADPMTRRAFRADPDAFLAGRELSAAEAEALISGTFAALFPLAQSTVSDDPTQQFNRFARTKDVLLVAEVVTESVVEIVTDHTTQHLSLDVHIHVEHHQPQMIAGPRSSMIVDGDGRLFQIRAAASR